MKVKSALMLTCNIMYHKQPDILTNKITRIIRDNSNKLSRYPANKIYLDPYEEAIGYNEYSRVGSRNFNENFGNVIEQIYNTSDIYNIFPKECNNQFSGYNDTTYFDSKARFENVKSVSLFKDVESKMQFSISNKKNFCILVLNEEPFQILNKGRNVPIHKALKSLKLIEEIPDYDPKTCRWISGIEIYKLLWPEHHDLVKKTIIRELYGLSGNL